MLPQKEIMLKNFMNIEEIKKEAITFFPGQKIMTGLYNYSVIQWLDRLIENPQFVIGLSEWSLGEDFIQDFEGAYNTNNSTLAFVDDGRIYVIPRMLNAEELVAEKYRKVNFFVPLSNGEKPISYERYKWKALQEAQDFAREHRSSGQNFV